MLHQSVTDIINRLPVEQLYTIWYQTSAKQNNPDLTPELEAANLTMLSAIESKVGTEQAALWIDGCS